MELQWLHVITRLPLRSRTVHVLPATSRVSHSLHTLLLISVMVRVCFIASNRRSLMAVRASS